MLEGEDLSEEITRLDRRRRSRRSSASTRRASTRRSGTSTALADRDGAAVRAPRSRSTELREEVGLDRARARRGVRRGRAGRVRGEGGGARGLEEGLMREPRALRRSSRSSTSAGASTSRTWSTCARASTCGRWRRRTRCRVPLRGARDVRGAEPDDPRGGRHDPLPRAGRGRGRRGAGRAGAAAPPPTDGHLAYEHRRCGGRATRSPPRPASRRRQAPAGRRQQPRRRVRQVRRAGSSAATTRAGAAAARSTRSATARSAALRPAASRCSSGELRPETMPTPPRGYVARCWSHQGAPRGTCQPALTRAVPPTRALATADSTACGPPRGTPSVRPDAIGPDMATVRSLDRAARGDRGPAGVGP